MLTRYVQPTPWTPTARKTWAGGSWGHPVGRKNAYSKGKNKLSLSITSVEFRNFKALGHFSLSLQHMNILVGPNNCGKSTILSAFRVLNAGIRRARVKNAEWVEAPEGNTYGYKLSEGAMPISTENVHTDYEESDSTVTFRMSNGTKLQLYFPVAGGCYLIPKTNTITIRTPSQFKSIYPISIGIVPVLGPVEHEEELLIEGTVRNGLSTHRASRHFRNSWYYYPDSFEEFATLVSKTWPGMEIEPAVRSDALSTKLVMFCIENRIPRELFWAGFGFQIWCQLLTHITRAKNDTILIIDEPEIYLHPDIQRQLLNIIRLAGPDILLATHSTEIMGEADHSEIMLVDKSKKSAQRLKDIEGVQLALDMVGSIQNITLTQLARNRRLIFVEGATDFRIIRRFALKLGYHELASGIDLTPVESGGFTSWESILSFARVFEKAVGSSVNIGVIYDRDYLPEEEVTRIIAELEEHLELAHIHDRKEIENYLLIPTALERVIKKGILEREKRQGIQCTIELSLATILDDVTTVMHSDIQGQYMAKRTKFFEHSKIDGATINAQTINIFSTKWNKMETRMEVVPGKDVLRKVREIVQDKFSINLTDYKIIDEININEIPQNLIVLIQRLERYRKNE